MHRYLTIIAGSVLLLFTVTALGSPDVDDMKTSLEAHKMKIQDLSRRVGELEASKMAPGAAAPNQFTVYWDNGIRMKTGDGMVTIQLGGRVFFDGIWITGQDMEYALDEDLRDGVEPRALRLYASGTIGKDLAFKLEIDFAGRSDPSDADSWYGPEGNSILKDAYLQFKNIPFIGTVTIGHFKQPMSLEELTSSRFITFMERALPNVFALGRAVGIMAHNTLFEKRMTWAVSAFRKTDDWGVEQRDGAYGFALRVTGLPYWANGGKQHVHLGASYALHNPEDTVRFRARPEAHLTEYFIDTGYSLSGVDLVHRWGVEMAMVWGPLSIQAEYMGAAVDQGSVTRSLCGFYVQASYFLTGEHRPYNQSKAAYDRVKPLKNFRENGGIGAVEVATRFSYLDLVDAGLDGGRMKTATVGLNWYLNPNMRLMFNYIHACADGVVPIGHGEGGNAEADIFMTRFAVDW